MTALTDASSPARPDPAQVRAPLIGVLRIVLLAEAILGVVLAIILSSLAAAEFSAGTDGENSFRFAAAAAFIFGIAAAIAARGARRRRAWAWTVAAILQLVLAIGTGGAILLAEWQPVFLVGFVLAVVAMLVLSTSSVRRALGQE
jgi:drug/metabolite transporter (DMT)-like permease